MTRPSEYQFDYEHLDRSTAAQAVESERAGFIRRTYGHLAGAILAFVAIEMLLFGVFFPTREAMTELVVRFFAHPINLIVLLVAFIGFGWLAQMWAASDTSRVIQYVGLSVYVVLEAIIFLPILCVAVHYINDRTILPTAAIMTLTMFGGLTAAVFTTRKDFSFLGPILMVAGFIALGLCIAAWIFGFTLGLLFSFAMVALSSAYILYDTSNILHHYRTDQHVAAALALFADVAMMFYYILRILIQLAAVSRE